MFQMLFEVLLHEIPHYKALINGFVVVLPGRNELLLCAIKLINLMAQQLQRVATQQCCRSAADAA